MKIYTSTFDLAYPSNARFWVAQNSDFKIGIKITNKGADYAGEFTLKSGSTTFTPDASKTAGFTTYTLKSLTPGGVTYTVEVPGAQQKFTLMQIVTDSTVFEVGALSGGGDVPADVATQSWVNSQISDFITEEALTGYVQQDELTAYATTDSLTAYATTDSLTAYAEKDDLTAYATTDSLTAYAEKDDLTAYATQNDLTSKADVSSLTAYAEVTSLTAYATKNDLTSKADVSSLTAYAETSALNAVTLSIEGALTAIADINDNQIPSINNVLGSCVQHQPYGEAPEVMNIIAAYESEWEETLSAEADENTFYVILPDPVTP